MADGYAHPEVLVTTEWVADHLNDPKVRIVESDEDVLLYETGHIPGAIKIDWHTDEQDQVRRDFIDKAGFERLMASRGIANDSTWSSTVTRTTGMPRIPSGCSRCTATRMPVS